MKVQTRDNFYRCKSRILSVNVHINIGSDIGIKEIQTKAIGLRNMMDVHNLKKENVLAIGDNYNDKEMMDCAGISVTADKTRVEGTYYVELNGEKLPADVMMTQILKVNGAKI